MSRFETRLSAVRSSPKTRHEISKCIGTTFEVGSWLSMRFEECTARPFIAMHVHREVCACVQRHAPTSPSSRDKIGDRWKVSTAHHATPAIVWSCSKKQRFGWQRISSDSRRIRIRNCYNPRLVTKTAKGNVGMVSIITMALTPRLTRDNMNNMYTPI